MEKKKQRLVKDYQTVVMSSDGKKVVESVNNISVKKIKFSEENGKQ